MSTSGNTAGQAEDFLVFDSSLSFFPCEEIFSISLQALFDSLKINLLVKTFFVCDLPFILFIIRKFYNS